MKYKTAAIGGTFDRLHKGHLFFIQQAFDIGENVIIGLTSDTYAEEKLKTHPDSIGTKLKTRVNKFKDRKGELEKFLREDNLSDRAEIVMINDIYGPAIEKSKSQTLVVTKETLEGALKVNKKRKELRMKKLDIVEIPLVLATDNKRISSTRIRLGEIDRWGRVFGRLSVYGSRISEGLRMSLKKPLGELIAGTAENIRREVIKRIKKNHVCIITVGDDATLFLNKLGKQADISIVDFHVKRIRIHNSLADMKFRPEFWKEKYTDKIVKAKNPAGYISRELVRAFEKVLKGLVRDGMKRIVEVDGEEDLAGVPAILLAPLDSMVLYGQPDQGIVAVEATEEKKKE